MYSNRWFPTSNISKPYIGRHIKEKVIREIEERVLTKDEELLAIINGVIETEFMDRTTVRNGYLICTTQRVIFYMPKLFGRWETEIYPLDQMSSVQFTRGLLTGRINITVFNDTKVIKWVDNEEGAKIVEIINEQLKQIKGAGNHKVEEDPLKVLKLRLAKGEITKEEYEELKRTLLEE